MKKAKPKLPPYYQRVKDPERLFDLVVWHSYVAGSMKGNIPVDETRQVFAVIRDLLQDRK